MPISQRLFAKELIDLGPDYYTADEYKDCLYQLDLVGRYLGGDAASFRAFDLLKQPLKSILDVGCGGGFFTLKLGSKYPSAQITGIDTSVEAINIANENLKKSSSHANVKFQVPLTPELNFPSKSFDVVTSTLVCHHLSEDELISFLKKSYAIAKQAVIINDLHRHSVALYGYRLIAPLFFRNRLVIHDGALSIQRGFTSRDWIAYLSAAKIPLERCIISWNWAFRWTLLIKPF